MARDSKQIESDVREYGDYLGAVANNICNGYISNVNDAKSFKGIFDYEPVKIGDEWAEKTPKIWLFLMAAFALLHIIGAFVGLGICMIILYVMFSDLIAFIASIPLCILFVRVSKHLWKTRKEFW